MLCSEPAAVVRSFLAARPRAAKPPRIASAFAPSQAIATSEIATTIRRISHSWGSVGIANRLFTSRQTDCYNPPSRLGQVRVKTRKGSG